MGERENGRPPKPSFQKRAAGGDCMRWVCAPKLSSNYATVCAGICAPKLYQRKLSFCDVICAGVDALRDVGQAQLTTKTKIKAPRYAPQVKSRWGLQAAWLIKTGYAQGMRRLMKPPPPDPQTQTTHSHTETQRQRIRDTYAQAYAPRNCINKNWLFALSYALGMRRVCAD